jgi:hypothetical protein
LPPIQKGCEFYSLDAAADPVPQKQTVKMSLHSPAGHVELPGDFSVVASLKQQLYNLLLSWS